MHRQVDFIDQDEFGGAEHVRVFEGIEEEGKRLLLDAGPGADLYPFHRALPGVLRDNGGDVPRETEFVHQAPAAKASGAVSAITLTPR